MNLSIPTNLPPMGGATPGGGSGSPGGPGGAGAAGKPEQSFQSHLDGGVNESQSTQATQGVNDPSKVNQTNQTDAAARTQKVTGDAKVPDRQDMFGHFDKVRKDFQQFVNKTSDVDKMVKEGKLRPDDPKVQAHRQSEMKQLMHFQMEMQGASMKVEIASKVVEHATSGLKTMMSTQA